MLKIAYNIYIYDKSNYLQTSDSYINIHQVWLDISLTQQQISQAVAQYFEDLYGKDTHYQYKYEMIHL